LIPTALLLALTFMAFAGNIENIKRKAKQRGTDVIMDFGLVALLVFFLCTTVLPYLVGANSGRNGDRSSSQRRREWLLKLGGNF